MQLLPIFFAAGVLESFRTWSASKSGGFQALVFFGVVIVLALVVFGWAIIFRQQPLRRHHRGHSKPAATTEDEGGNFLSRRRHKQRRKKHRPVNPTLAETGGLPDARDGNTPPKSQL